MERENQQVNIFGNMIRNGFLIKDGKIFDTKIQSYEIVREYVGDNIIYSMKPKYYKRLYIFEALLNNYSVEMVFDLLDFNSYLKKQREVFNLIKDNKLHYISNMSTIYNYPPTFLTKRKFALYKTCQNLKKRVE